MFKRLLSRFYAASPADTAEQETPAAPPLERLRAIRATLWDTSARFSMSQIDTELDKIEAALDRKQTTDRETRGELAYARAYLNARRGEHQKALDNYTVALSAHDATGFLPPKLAISARIGIGLAHEALGNSRAALDAMALALPAMEAAEERNNDQIGGLMETMAFHLHELGRFDEALAMNQRLQQLAARVLPPDAPELCVMLTNTAQNLHALDRPEEAAEYLKRCLAIAHQHHDHDRVVDMTFQLGVLAYEAGRTEDARDLMTAAARHADDHGDDWLQSRANTRLVELEDRIAAKA